MRDSTAPMCNWATRDRVSDFGDFLLGGRRRALERRRNSASEARRSREEAAMERSLWVWRRPEEGWGSRHWLERERVRVRVWERERRRGEERELEGREEISSREERRRLRVEEMEDHRAAKDWRVDMEVEREERRWRQVERWWFWVFSGGFMVVGMMMMMMMMME